MSTFATPDNPKGWAPDVQGLAPKEVIPEALIIQTSSRAGTVEGDAPAVRVPYVDLTDQADFVAEGTAIPESDEDGTELVIHTSKVAMLVTVSREQYAQTDAATLLSDSMRIGLIRKANARYLSQVAPSGPATNPPAGLLNLSPTNGGAVSGDLDAVVDAIATIEDAGGSATHIIASPTAWAELSKLKAATGSNVSLVGAGVEAAVRTLLSVPVLVTNSMTDNGLLVLDKNAVISAYGDVQLATSSEYAFNRDAITLRATFRFGQKIADTSRVVKLSVTPEGS